MGTTNRAGIEPGSSADVRAGDLFPGAPRTARLEVVHPDGLRPEFADELRSLAAELLADGAPHGDVVEEVAGGLSGQQRREALAIAFVWGVR